MEHSVRKRCIMIVSAVVAIIGLSTVPSDAAALANSMIDEVTDNPLGIGAIILGIGVIIFALWDDILGWLGLYSRKKLANIIKDTLHLEHGYKLVETSVGKDKFSIIVAFRNHTVQIESEESGHRIHVAGGIKLNPAIVSNLDALDESQRVDDLGYLKNELMLHLTAIDVQFGIDQDHSELRVKLVHSIVINNKPFDRYALLQAIGVIFRGQGMVDAVISRWHREMSNRLTMNT